MAAAMLLFGNFLFIYSQAAGMHGVIEHMRAQGDRRFSFRLVKYALLTPAYWALMSIAAVKAFWQLMTRPFYWEKTVHGLARKNRLPHAAGPAQD